MKKLTPHFVLPGILVILFLSGNMVSCKRHGLKNQKPNIILILADDLGWTDAGFMGSDFYETPALDRLASEGMVFTSAYANAPNCAPTRACLLSGQYTPRHGVYTVNNSQRGRSEDRKLIPVLNTTVLDTHLMTIAEALKRQGYVSASIGKWHLGQDPESGPAAQGFDLNIAGDQKGHPKSYFSPYENDFIPDGPEGEYLTDRLTDEALRFIQDHSDQTFFLYLPHFAVHTPIQAKVDKIDHYANKSTSGSHKNPEYAAMIESLDEGVGKIISLLDELKIRDKTLVVFFSDNGPHGAISGAEPLRGSKGMLYEGGIREPLIVSWPGRIKEGSNCDIPVIGIDLFPTFLEVAGIKNFSDQILDGQSIVPLLSGKKRWKREAVFWHFPAYLERYAGMDQIFRITPAGAIRKGNWKLIEFFENGTIELYNLKEDIEESHELSKTHPEKTLELHNDLLQWRESINAPVPTELNPEYILFIP